MPPVLLATAKTVYLRGHLIIERWILKNKSRRVWTRDEMTAAELKKSYVEAVYSGNPIMDLASDNNIEADETLWPKEDGYKVLLLPGSRQDAYNDVRLLLGAAELVSKEVEASFLMVIAPSIEWDKMASNLKDYSLDCDILVKDGLKVKVTFCPVSSAAEKADILLGLGGTANQVCAGLGVPVVSIDDKGKRVQKKLLGDAEVLVKRDPRKLALEVVSILKNRERHKYMSSVGRQRMGRPGAIEDVSRYLLYELGWKHRHDLYCFLEERLLHVSEDINNGEEVKLRVE